MLTDRHKHPDRGKQYHPPSPFGGRQQIFMQLSPKSGGFPNSSDSKKNELCQFCRMCSFLFTESGGKKHSAALKHDGKRYSSKLGEVRPHLFTTQGQSSFSLNRAAEIHHHTPRISINSNISWSINCGAIFCSW